MPFAGSGKMLPDLVEGGLIVPLTEAVRLDISFQRLDFSKEGRNAIASASGAYEVHFRLLTHRFLFVGFQKLGQ